MPVRITKQGKETAQDTAKRFIKAVKKSGMLLEMRKKAFTKRKKSKNMRKRAALMKITAKSKYEKLKKLGLV